MQNIRFFSYAKILATDVTDLRAALDELHAIRARLDAVCEELAAGLPADDCPADQDANLHLQPPFRERPRRDDPELVDISRLWQRYQDYHPSTVRRWADRDMCGVQVGARWLISPHRVRQLLAQR